MSLSTLLSTRTRQRTLRGLAAGALCLGMLGGAPAQAQTPSLIGYQAAVFDDQGQPAAGPVDVDVAIFDSSTAGTGLYSESHPGVALVDGAFDIQIGAGISASGTLDADTFATSEAWLELTVDGEVLDPRQRLVAVPYALRAAVAESLDGTIGSVPFAQSLRSDVEEAQGAEGDLLTVNLDANGLPTSDGARVYFNQSYLDGVWEDALVIEKTDANSSNPDGGIVFANKGADGVSEMSMQIDGAGNVGIPAVYATGRLSVHTADQRAANLWTNDDDMAVYAYNGGTGEAIVAQSLSSTYQRATIRSVNSNTAGGVAGYFRNESPEATMSVYNFGSGPGLIVRSTGASDIVSAWTRPAGASSSTKEFWVDGSGVTNVRTLKIHGGADLSESFDVAPPAPGIAIEPGTIVAIDPDDPGKLVVNAGAYNRTVAGVVAGAGGIQPGMLLRQEGVAEADGEHPVALTGRVYAKADTSNGPIRPGDLLTTSGRAGHAMKARDWQRSQGAVLGKAMSSLDDGTGLVLVLVGLQ